MNFCSYRKKWFRARSVHVQARLLSVRSKPYQAWKPEPEHEETWNIFYAHPSLCLKKKAILLCEWLFLSSIQNILSAFRRGHVIFQKIAWFCASDGSHCKVHVHFEEFVSHRRFQTLAAELQNGISKIFPGEILFLKRLVV